MKASRIKLCREKNCRDQQTTEGYCRFHYLKNWKKIIKDKKKNKEKQDKYIALMAEKYSGDAAPEMSDDVRDEIIGRHAIKNHLLEIGISAKDLKEEKDDNPFQNADVDVLLENIKYDDNY